MLTVTQLTLARRIAHQALDSRAELFSFDGEGEPVLEFGVDCAVRYPTAQEGIVYPDDQRRATVFVPVFNDEGEDLHIPDTVERVVVNGTANYRVDHVPPKRAMDLLREIRCVEAREGL